MVGRLWGGGGGSSWLCADGVAVVWSWRFVGGGVVGWSWRLLFVACGGRGGLWWWFCVLMGWRWWGALAYMGGSPPRAGGREVSVAVGAEAEYDHLFMDSKVRILAYQTLVSMSNNRGL